MHRRLPRSPGLLRLRLQLQLCSPQRAPHRWLLHLCQLKKAFSAGSRTCLATSLSRHLSSHRSSRLQPKSALAKRAAMDVASAVSRVVNSAANAVVVMADAAVVAARRGAPKAVRKVVSKARVVPTDVRKAALMVAPKAVAENAASAIRKVAAMPVVRNARNAQPVKPETTAIQKAAPTTAPKTVNRANHEGKAAVADATAAMAVTVVSSAHRVTRSSKTSQRPIRRPWQRPRVATQQLHRRVVRTERPLKLAKIRVSVRKATANSAVNAAVAAMTAEVSAVKGQRARTPHLTQ